jgi:hypothetical protein
VVECDTLLGEFVGDVRGVSERTSEAIELCDDESVARADRCEGGAEARTFTRRSRHAVVDVHVQILNAESVQAVPLCREVLPRGRDTGISDQHGGDWCVSRTLLGQFRGTACRDLTNPAIAFHSPNAAGVSGKATV